MQNLQLGIRLHDTAPGTLEERLAAARAQGFTCAHLALSKVGMPNDTQNLTPGYATQLRHVFETAGIDMAVIGNYLNLAHPDAGKLADITDKYIAYMRFASLLGCSVVGSETGAPNPEYRYDKEACHSEAALRTFITNVRPVVKAAEQFGVIFAIEPVYKHIVWNPQRARTVLDEIGSPNLQIILDPVNLLHPDNLDHRDEVIEEAIDLLGKDVAVIHLKDYQLVTNENGEQDMPCMACGLGEMDYRPVLRFAKERKPYIQATMENTRPENAEAARKYIEDLYCSL